MYTLYYVNENMNINTLETASLDEPLRIPERLIFVALREGINFIKEPHKCIAFTDFERLIMSSDYNDLNFVNESHYRKENTYLEPLCQVNPPLILDRVETDEAFWNYPKPVLVLASKLEEGPYYPLIRDNESSSMFINSAPMMTNVDYWVMLKDVEKGIFSNKMRHAMPV
jgi:hypothetical protein